MTASIIDGKAFAANLRAQVMRRVAALKARHRMTPGLTVVLVGDDPASQIYVRNKGKQTVEAGMRSEEFRLAADSSQDTVLSTVARLNGDPAVHGILVQLPLPKHIDPLAVIGTIDPAKDVDGLHPINIGRLVQGEPAMVPCTPLGCLMLIKDRRSDLAGQKALVIGRSQLVGKPMAQLLLNESCTVTVAHSRTRDLAAECRQADILVAAVGRAEMVRGCWIKPGAVVIDVGMNRLDLGNGKNRLVGDVHFAEAAEVAGAITPVPGGVGPMTVACLLVNTLTAACRRAGIAPESLDG
ncbi:MAG TPA: bifunctional methylenetetrahydrofolate dehydrogenase/methenyltetrahydrofolate cyclohydrolase FolD [Candidatus Cybelea sp.]|nr:bifunctional methylenetetrahydrofolate dehydrogenase/methenyltetrahydrofolate cyclohydrolase FolD [Candidatus Cybelea sp.]